MIPHGSDHLIRNAMGYLPPEKVLAWARAMICPSITSRDLRRLQGRAHEPRRIGTAADTRLEPIGPRAALTDSGALAKRIEAYIARLAKLNACSPAEIKGAFGWR